MLLCGDSLEVLKTLDSGSCQCCVTSPPYYGLRDDGTLWLNLGDTYKNKQLLGMPWRVALALQADGWYLRQDIIWAKPNPMPESVRDRCTRSHEYIFLLSKKYNYYFDAKAIAEQVAESTVARLGQMSLFDQAGSSRVPGKTKLFVESAVRPADKKGF